MNRSSFALPVIAVLLATVQAPAQSPSAGSSPVSYASVNQVNELIAPLEQTSQQTLSDLAGLRVDKWKTDSGTKKQTQADVGSIQRNLQSALPEMITEVKNSPESLTPTFKLYRNLDALYDVFSGVVENAGAFGSKEEYQSLGTDLASFEKARRSVGDRMESLAGTKDTEIAQLRSQLRTAQAAAEPAGPVKKTVVDDTEPAKKTAKKKTTTGKSTTSQKTAAQSSSQKPSSPSPSPSQPQQ